MRIDRNYLANIHNKCIKDLFGRIYLTDTYSMKCQIFGLDQHTDLSRQIIFKRKQQYKEYKLERNSDTDTISFVNINATKK